MQRIERSIDLSKRLEPSEFPTLNSACREPTIWPKGKFWIYYKLQDSSHLLFLTVWKHLSTMVAKALLTSISLALSLVGAVSGIKSSGTNSSDIVTWDKYSLKINNERLFTFSGEFHVSSNFSGKYWQYTTSRITLAVVLPPSFSRFVERRVRKVQSVRFQYRLYLFLLGLSFSQARHLWFWGC